MRHARLCELNVIEQVVNVCQTTVVQDAWARGQALSVHGWVYSLLDGRVRNMGMDVSAPRRTAPSLRHSAGATERQARRRSAMSDVIQRQRSARSRSARYPHARRVGNLLFLSGIGPRDPATNAILGNEYYADGRVRQLRHRRADAAPCSPTCARCWKPAARAGRTWST